MKKKKMKVDVGFDFANSGKHNTHEKRREEKIEGKLTLVFESCAVGGE
jgi:hypothetical protein